MNIIGTENENELRDKYGNGFYFTDWRETGERYAGRRYIFTGNTNWNGEDDTTKKGEDVKMIFPSSKAKQMFIKMVWPGFMESSEHLHSLQSRTKSEKKDDRTVVSDQYGKVREYKKHKLIGYRSPNTGKWVDILFESRK